MIGLAWVEVSLLPAQMYFILPSGGLVPQWSVLHMGVGASFDASLRTSLGASRTSPKAQRHIGSLVNDAARFDPFALLEPNQRLPRLGPQHAVHRTVVVAVSISTSCTRRMSMSPASMVDLLRVSYAAEDGPSGTTATTLRL
jgi:hypothetical protein